MRLVLAALGLCVTLAGGAALTGPPAEAGGARRAGAEVLPTDYATGSWMLYRSVFMMPEGRISDKENGGISHSEGQGYGMLIAAAADDRASFDALWDWTRRELMIRDDGLVAWKWDPAAEPHVADRNNATDGDLLIAWALLRGARQWDEPSYAEAAKALADAVARHAAIRTDEGALILPGVEGFATGPADAPVVNLSYWVMPAIEELSSVSADLAALDLVGSGLDLARRIAQAGFPVAPDWTSLGGEAPAPAAGFEPVSGYNAVRIPLYLAWAGSDHADLVAPYAKAWSGERGPGVLDLASGQVTEPMPDPGYRAVADLLDCSLGETPKAVHAAAFAPTSYYASTLHILSQMALSERYPQCL